MILRSCVYDRISSTASGLRVTYGRLKHPVAEFIYEGRDENGTLHLWQEDGRWASLPHAEPHPFDLKIHTQSS